MSSVNMPQTQAPGSNQFGQGANSSQGSNPYVNANKRDIGGVFNANIDLFRDPDTGKVTQEQLREIANRPMTGRVAEDNMTMLANEVLRRPELNSKLVPKSEWEPPKTDEKNKELPVGGKGDCLQRQRVENSDKGTGQANPFAGNSDAQLADYALAAFSSLADKDGAITHDSLTSVASGERSDGKPASKAEINLANALLEKGTFFNQLDKGDGTLDGRITREALDKVSNPHDYMSELQLVENFDNLFSTFLRPDEKFVSTDDIREAAGERPTTRVFSDEAKALAKELLKHPDLIRRMDSAATDDGKVDGLIGTSDLRNLKSSLSKPSE
jgi:hypothetical protein